MSRIGLVFLGLALALISVQAEIWKSEDLFTVEFFKAITKKERGNVLASPFGAYWTFMMAGYGAETTTKADFEKVLWFDNAPEEPENLVRRYKEWKELKNATIRVANKILIPKEVTPVPTYEKILREIFESDITPIDIHRPEQVVREINEWVDLETEHKIKEIFKPNDINADAAMFLLNAVYFQSNWLLPFDKTYTFEDKFHMNDKEEKMVKMMFTEREFYHGYVPELGNAQFVILPYKEEGLDLVFVIPETITGLQDMRKFETKKLLPFMNVDYLKEIGKYEKIRLYLPKFTIEQEINLRKPLREMGLEDAFTHRADFSSMFKNKKSFISKATQKTYMAVDELGTEAAALTAIEQVNYSLSDSPVVKIDRPSFFFLNMKGTHLFGGRLYEP